MPMSDVPNLAWSNRPIPMFKAGFQPVICNAHTRKMQHMQWWNLFYPCTYPCIAFFGTTHALLISCVGWVRHVGNWPLYCRSARGREGTSLVWSTVGWSAWLLGIVTRPILAVSCSSQHLIMRVSSETACHCRSMSSLLSAISLPRKLSWNLKPYTTYCCHSHFREAQSPDCDITIREERWHGLVHGRNAHLKVLLSKWFLENDCRCKMNRWWTGCGEKILESAHFCVTIHHGKVVQRTAVDVDQRGADAQIFCLRQSADFDERSAPTGRWYMTASSHCQLSVISAWFSTMSCSEITRSHIVKTCRKLCFLKEDSHPSTSANFH